MGSRGPAINNPTLPKPSLNQQLKKPQHKNKCKTLQTLVPQDADIKSEKLAVEDRLVVRSTAGWVKSPQALLLPHNGRGFEIQVRPGRESQDAAFHLLIGCDMFQGCGRIIDQGLQFMDLLRIVWVGCCADLFSCTSVDPCIILKVAPRVWSGMRCSNSFLY